MRSRAAAGLVLSGALAGCAAPGRSADIVPSALVRPGWCHRLADPAELYAPSDVAPPVSCSTPHESETLATVRLPLGLTRLPAPPEHAGSLAGTLCAGPVGRTLHGYLGADDFDRHWGIDVWLKVPTQEEWAKGLRIARCDLVLSRNGPRTVPSLSHRLRGALRRTDSAVIRHCRRGTLDVTCDKPHTAEAVGGWTGIVGDVYPGAGEAAARLQDQCWRNAEQYTEGAVDELPVRPMAGPLTADDWQQQGKQTTDCWIINDWARTTVGTLRDDLRRRGAALPRSRPRAAADRRVRGRNGRHRGHARAAVRRWGGRARRPGRRPAAHVLARRRGPTRRRPPRPAYAHPLWTTHHWYGDTCGVGDTAEPYHSTELWLLWPAKYLSALLFGDHGELDLRALGVLCALLAGLLCAGLVLALRGPVWVRTCVAAGIGAVFADSTFAGYFVSPYSEPAALLGIVATLLALVVIWRRGHTTAPTLVFVGAGALFTIGAKSSMAGFLVPITIGLLTVPYGGFLPLGRAGDVSWGKGRRLRWYGRRWPALVMLALTGVLTLVHVARQPRLSRAFYQGVTATAELRPHYLGSYPAAPGRRPFARETGCRSSAGSSPPIAGPTGCSCSSGSCWPWPASWSCATRSCRAGRGRTVTWPCGRRRPSRPTCGWRC